MGRAGYGHERVEITKNGKPAAVLIGPEGLERLQMLRDVAEYRTAKAADDGERASLGDLLSELPGSERPSEFHELLRGYSVEFPPVAAKEVRKLDPGTRRRILAGIAELGGGLAHPGAISRSARATFGASGWATHR